MGLSAEGRVMASCCEAFPMLRACPRAGRRTPGGQERHSTPMHTCRAILHLPAVDGPAVVTVTIGSMGEGGDQV